MSQPILQVEHLKKYFPAGGRKVLRAVDDVSFSVQEGEILGIVGESGCGKTTCGRTAIGLYSKTDGVSLYRGEDIHRMRGAKRRAFCCQVQTVFQDPYASLDPKNKVIDLIAEGMDIHHLYTGPAERREKVQALIQQVGLNPSGIDRYPYGPEGVVGLKVKGRNSAGDVPAVSVTTNVQFDLTVTWGDGQSRTVRVEKSGSVKLN